MSLVFKKVGIEHLKQIDKLLSHKFFPREPLSIAFGNTDPKWYESWMRQLTQPRIEKQKVSFGCFDKDRLVGLCLNSLEFKDESKNVVSFLDVMKNNSPNESYNKVGAFLESLHKKIDLFADLESLGHIELGSVEKEYGQHGIAKELVALSLKEFSEMEIQGAYAETTGRYSGKILQGLNFERLISINYKDHEETKDFNMGDHAELVIWRKKL